MQVFAVTICLVAGCLAMPAQAELKKRASCEPVTITTCLGSGVIHSLTSTPIRVPFGPGPEDYDEYQSQREAFREARPYQPLLQRGRGCREFLRPLVCAVYLPACDDDTGEVLPPCRDLCEMVESNCRRNMRHLGIDWPRQLDCTRFPSSTENPKCISALTLGEVEVLPTSTPSDDEAVEVRVSCSYDLSPELQPQWLLPDGTQVPDNNGTPEGISAVRVDKHTTTLVIVGFRDYFHSGSYTCTTGDRGFARSIMLDDIYESPQDSGACEEMTSRWTCRGDVSFNRVRLPNSQGMTTQSQIYQEVFKYNPVSRTSCSRYLNIFLCNTYLVDCEARRNDKRRICRDICEKVHSECADEFRANRLMPPSCEGLVYQSDGECYNGVEIDPSIQVFETPTGKRVEVGCSTVGSFWPSWITPYAKFSSSIREPPSHVIVDSANGKTRLVINDFIDSQDAGVYTCTGDNTFNQSITIDNIYQPDPPLPNYTVQLINGPHDCSGKLEIWSNGSWYSTCGYYGNSYIGQTVCQQLGCGDFVTTDKDFGPVYGRKLFPFNVNCYRSGYPASNLAECEFREPTRYCWSATNQAVECAPRNPEDNIKEYAVRLVGGSSPHSGLVQMYKDGEWGHICADFTWTSRVGLEVCKQLGFRDGAYGLRGDARYGPFGMGSGRVLPSWFRCDISTGVKYCYNEAWYDHSCDHSRDAAVMCRTGHEETNIRLVNGAKASEGTVEVFFNDEWGTVCDDEWTEANADVVCRQLGYASHKRPFRSGNFGGAIGKPFMLTNVRCYGPEKSLFDCPKSKWYDTADCKSYDVVGVQCEEEEPKDLVVSTPVVTSRTDGGIDVSMNCSAVSLLDDASLPDDTPRWVTPDGAVLHFNDQEGNVQNNVIETGVNHLIIEDFTEQQNGGQYTCRIGSYSKIIVLPALILGEVEVIRSGTQTDDEAVEVRVSCSYDFLPELQPQWVMPDGTPITEDDKEQIYADRMDEHTTTLVIVGFQDSINSGSYICTMGDRDSAQSITLASIYEPDSDGCEEMTSRWTCRGDVSFNRVRLPNSQGMTTQLQIYQEVFKYNPVSRTSCSRYLQVFLCNTYLVDCDARRNDKQGICRDICEKVHSECADEFRANRLTPPSCEGLVYQSDGECYNGVEIDPSIQVFETPTGKRVEVGCSTVGSFWTAWITPHFKLSSSIRDPPSHVIVDSANGKTRLVINDFIDSQDAGVYTCTDDNTFNRSITIDNIYQPDPPLPEYSVRLINGPHDCSGKLEIWSNGSWYSTCGYYGNSYIGQTVCQQLGCGAFMTTDKDFGPVYGRKLFPFDVNCYKAGDPASNVAACEFREPTRYCWSATNQAVECVPRNPEDIVEEYAVRLVGGSSPHSGLVQMYKDGEWGHICADYTWTSRVGSEVCKQLGFNNGVYSVRADARYGPFGMGSGRLLPSWFRCDISTGVKYCYNEAWYDHSCDHSRDAAVVCRTGHEETDIRLMNGAKASEGNVEVFFNNEWGTVCDDEWTEADADVVCRQLGYASHKRPLRSDHFGNVTGKPFMLTNIRCYGFEKSLFRCRKSDWYDTARCKSYNVVGVQCEEAPEVPTFALDVTVTSVSTDSITVEWPDPNPPDETTQYTYHIAYRKSGDETYHIVSDVTQLMYRITDLGPSQTYDIKLRASTAAGHGPWSSPLSVTTLRPGDEIEIGSVLREGSSDGQSSASVECTFNGYPAYQPVWLDLYGSVVTSTDASSRIRVDYTSDTVTTLHISGFTDAADAGVYTCLGQSQDSGKTTVIGALSLGPLAGPGPTPSVTQPTDQSPCEEIRVPACQVGIGYSSTYVPSLVGLSQDDVADIFTALSVVFENPCTSYFRPYMCALYLPPCREKAVLPCQELCLLAVNNCAETLKGAFSEAELKNLRDNCAAMPSETDPTTPCYSVQEVEIGAVGATNTGTRTDYSVDCTYNLLPAFQPRWFSPTGREIAGVSSGRIRVIEISNTVTRLQIDDFSVDRDGGTYSCSGQDQQVTVDL